MNLPKVILLRNKTLTTAEKNVHLVQYTGLILVNNDDDKNHIKVANIPTSQIFTQQETAGALKAQADAVAQEAAVTAGTEKS